MMRLGWLLRMILVVFSWERLLPSVEIENERRLVDEWVVFPGVSVRPSFARHDKDTRRPQTASRSRCFCPPEWARAPTPRHLVVHVVHAPRDRGAGAHGG